MRRVQKRGRFGEGGDVKGLDARRQVELGAKEGRWPLLIVAFSCLTRPLLTVLSGNVLTPLGSHRDHLPGAWVTMEMGV